MRWAPYVLVFLAALGLAAYLALGQRPGEDALDEAGGRAALEDEAGASLTAPDLTGMKGPERGPRGPGAEPQPPAPVATPEPAAEPGEIFASVRVVDAESGAPLAGAMLWFEPAREPCPRLPDEAYLQPPPSPLSSSIRATRHRADEQGRFVLDAGRFARPSGPALDVFATQDGYVTGMACGIALGGSAEVRLARGLMLAGVVRDARGQALAEVVVLARPAASTPPIPGHAGWAVSDENGRFRIEGLLPGAVRLTLRRESYYPLDVPAEDPAQAGERAYVMAPAFVVRFRLRTDDGRPVVNPIVRLVTNSRPPVTRLEMVAVLGDETPDGVLTQGVAVPAVGGSVYVEVKAEGYAAHVRPEEPVPPEGGEVVLPVTLARDTSQGALRIVCEDERGTRLIYHQLGALLPSITPLERQNLGSGAALQEADELIFPSLPLGRYRIVVRTHAYAPGVLDATVAGGTQSEVRLALKPAAKLRVRFTAPTSRIVRFRLWQDGTPVPALPEPNDTTPMEGTPGSEVPVLAAGEAGVLLGGLASGTYQVEVLNEDLVNSRTPVRVSEGAIEELEIRVQPR